MERIHATCIAIQDAGVLLFGASGSGKSDLALRLIDSGAELVADDYTEIETVNGRLFAHAPEAIAGMLEVRSLGVVRVDWRTEVPVALVIELTSREDIERMPETEYREIDGVRLPVFHIDPFESSAPAKVRMMMQTTQHTTQVSP